MSKIKYYGNLYLDREKDIVIEFYQSGNSYSYILKTPNHKSGNLIRNLAKICDLPLSLDDNGLLIIKGELPSFINDENKRIYILKFANKTVAIINEEGEIKARASIPAISKTLMSQSKDISLSLDKIFVRTYIEEKYKFKTDLHCHMNAILHPDFLIALGIKHQILYPYYYVLKLGLKLTTKQEEKILKQREKVANKFKDTKLVGKYKERRINDLTYINFTDLILNNIENAAYNIEKIRASLFILKDGQAVFTNLEKVYLYRYVFTKGIESKTKIKLKNLDSIPDLNIRNSLSLMIKDTNDIKFKNFNLIEDKLLWIARNYAYQGIYYVEISNTTLVKNEAVDFIEMCHKVLPIIENETHVKIRFLAALRRIPLTIIKDKVASADYLVDNLNVLKAVAKDPYVVGCDIVGEEINDIRDLKPVINEIVNYCNLDEFFTIRIHAGENDSLTNNVASSIQLVKESLKENQKFPKLRIGHGLYVPSLTSKKGKKLIKDIKDNNVVLEFQLTSNVRLNNLNSIESHPVKEYLNNNVKCLQGSDGGGVYGTNMLDEELALINFFNLKKEDLMKMINVENEIIEFSNIGFIKKTKLFNYLIKNLGIRKTLETMIENNRSVSQNLSFKSDSSILSFNALNNQIKELPTNKLPIIICGGSFNADTRNDKLLSIEKELIDELLKKLSPKKYFFVIGHKLKSYEKYLFEKNNGKFDLFAIVPASISKTEKNHLLKAKVNIRISTESLGMGIYKSFNYEIFERRKSVLIAMMGNSAALNLIQEANNGKAKALIYISNNDKHLKQKADYLSGYVNIYSNKKDIDLMIKNIKRIMY